MLQEAWGQGSLRCGHFGVDGAVGVRIRHGNMNSAVVVYLEKH